MSKKIINKNGTVTIIDNFKTSVKIEQIGKKGNDGKSSYTIWLENGNIGTEQDFLNSLVGPKGDDGDNGLNGKSSYTIWLENGNIGTEQDFLNSLIGPKGNDGEGVTIGGTQGQVLAKKTNTNFDTEWIDVVSGENFNLIVGSSIAYNNGTSGAALFSNKNITGTSQQGQQSLGVPNGTTLYDLRFRNLFRTADNPSLATSQIYYSPTFPKIYGNENVFGFKTEIDFAIDTALDNKHKFFVGELSSFVNIPNLQNGPSNYQNCVGFGYDELDTVFHIYINNNTINPTKIPLSSFSGNLQANDYTARLTQQPILITIEVLNSGNTINFKYKHLLSGRIGTYILNNPPKKPVFNAVLKPAIALCGGQNLPVGDSFSVYSFFMSKNIR